MGRICIRKDKTIAASIEFFIDAAIVLFVAKSVDADGMSALPDY